MRSAYSITYAVADLHGRRDLLDMAIVAIAADAALRPGTCRTVVWLGDYVDRGPDSRGVIDRLMAGPGPGWRWICLAGNHDTSLLEATYGNGIKTWFRNGGRATLASYGEASEAWPFDAVPAAHMVWIAGLPSIHTDAHRIFVHGGVDPALPTHAQADDVLQRKRYADDDPGHHPDGHVVHGHKSNRAGPVLQRGRTGLDTLAWATGRLSVAVFDDDRAGGPVDFIEVRGAPAPDMAGGGA